MESLRADVVVIGGGSCGCVVAARLSEDPECSVLLLEAGPAVGVDGAYPAEISDASVLPIGPGSAWTGIYPAELTPGQPRQIARGRVLGGSSAVNGGYFVRARPSDFDDWPPGWSFENVLPYFVRSERDSDFGGDAHGSTGPIPVARTRGADRHPVSAAFHTAAIDLGFAEDEDKNDPAAGGGVGPVPSNIAAGVRVNAAAAYLLPARARRNLTVVGDAVVNRVIVKGGKAVGAVATIGSRPVRVHADTVVVSAGAVLTPQLLMVSGIGPAQHLSDHGIAVVHDSAWVGRDFSDHPEVGVYYRLRAGEADRRPTAVLEAVLHAGEVEIRAFTAPFDRSIPGLPIGDAMVGVGLMRPHSRGAITLRSADPAVPPLVEYRYLAEKSDRDALRDGVDIAHELLNSPAMNRVASPPDADADSLGRLGTSLHLSGSCAMGVDEDSVLDEQCRVRGIDGLRVVDTSAFPMVPSRGPHATAIMLAERASDLIRGRRLGDPIR